MYTDAALFKLASACILSEAERQVASGQTRHLDAVRGTQRLLVDWRSPPAAPRVEVCHQSVKKKATTVHSVHSRVGDSCFKVFARNLQLWTLSSSMTVAWVGRRMHVRNGLISDSTTILILICFKSYNCWIAISLRASCCPFIWWFHLFFNVELHCHMHHLHICHLFPLKKILFSILLFLFFLPIMKHSHFGRSALIRQNPSSRKTLFT